MPVKNKRNELSRKHHNQEYIHHLYTTSFMDDDDDNNNNSNSGTSPPPLCIPPPRAFAPASPHSDTESHMAREAVAFDEGQLNELSLYEGGDGEQAEEEQHTSLDAPAPSAPPKPVGPLHVEYQAQHQDVGRDDISGHGHVRSPVLAREPSTLESFSRSIRSYVPSSIPIPSALPTPPRVSRPVSFGSFLSPSRVEAPASPHRRVISPPTDNAKRRGSDVSVDHHRFLRDLRGQDELNSGVFNLDEEVKEPTRAPSHTYYPSTDQGEEILWSRWDALPGTHKSVPRKALVLGYPTGLQIWDCSDLGSISEVLNLSGPMWTGLATTQVLVASRPARDADPFEANRPLLGLLRLTGETQELLIYSLRSHAVVHAIRVPSLISFASSSDFLVLSTSRPSSLHVLSSRTFDSLYTVPSSSIAPFIHSHITEQSNTVLPRPLDHANPPIHNIAIPEPVFALSNRLLAFASVPPKLDASTQGSPRTLRTAMSDVQEHGIRLPLSQTDLGTAAMKLGGSMLSGMKVLGGMAFTAARAGVSAAISADSGRTVSSTNHPASPAPGRFFSRSAPEASVYGDNITTTSAISNDDGGNARNLRESSSPPAKDDLRGVGVYSITVLDLKHLVKPGASPQVIAEFAVGQDQPITKIMFSSNGTSISVAFRDGQTMKVYSLRPAPRPQASDQKSGTNKTDALSIRSQREVDHDVPSPYHIYNLRRGRTSAVVESMDWANDERWFAVGTRKRTVHVFATNPYGGPSDEYSHFEGRVLNVAEVPSLSTELHPVVRLRVFKGQNVEQRSLPLTFTFVPSSTQVLSDVPPSTPSSPSSGRSPSVASNKAAERTGHHQDILIFDPIDGQLSMRRLTPLRRPHDPIRPAAGAIGLPGGQSISLPGVSSMHRFTGTTIANDGARKPSGLTRMMERPAQVTYHEAVVATWTLRRKTDWKEIKHPLRPAQYKHNSSGYAKSDWLAQAELSTCSTLTTVVPRSIYLAHQFSLFQLGEDYHALLRSYHFDVPSHKVEVRRQIEVSAAGPEMSESFVSGSSLPSHSAFPSSFDEPLASALSANLQRNKPSPPILPMYPNGPIPRSVRSTIPIRHVAAGISDGMSEGLGRLRREIGKVRSPQLVPRRDSSSVPVPLEFDEEDEDFMSLDATTQGSREGGSVSTPSTGNVPLPSTERDADVSWEEWDSEDKEAVNEIEQFDDIAVGFMDEEWSQMTATRH